MVKITLTFALCSGALLTTMQAQVEPTAGSWKTWVLTSGNELRVPPPPPTRDTAAEIAWLKTYQSEARQSTETMKQMRYWTAGPPSYRWMDQMLKLIET